MLYVSLCKLQNTLHSQFCFTEMLNYFTFYNKHQPIASHAIHWNEGYEVLRPDTAEHWPRTSSLTLSHNDTHFINTTVTFLTNHQGIHWHINCQSCQQMGWSLLCACADHVKWQAVATVCINVAFYYTYHWNVDELVSAACWNSKPSKYTAIANSFFTF
jgi:hypothetical protein